MSLNGVCSSEFFLRLGNKKTQHLMKNAVSKSGCTAPTILPVGEQYLVS